MATTPKPRDPKAMPDIFGKAIDLAEWEPDYQRIEDAVGYIDPKRNEFKDHAGGLGFGKRLVRHPARS